MLKARDGERAAARKTVAAEAAKLQQDAHEAEASAQEPADAVPTEERLRKRPASAAAAAATPKVPRATLKKPAAASVSNGASGSLRREATRDQWAAVTPERKCKIFKFVPSEAAAKKKALAWLKEYA